MDGILIDVEFVSLGIQILENVFQYDILRLAFRELYARADDGWNICKSGLRIHQLPRLCSILYRYCFRFTCQIRLLYSRFVDFVDVNRSRRHDMVLGHIHALQMEGVRTVVLKWTIFTMIHFKTSGKSFKFLRMLSFCEFGEVMKGFLLNKGEQRQRGGLAARKKEVLPTGQRWKGVGSREID